MMMGLRNLFHVLNWEFLVLNELGKVHLDRNMDGSSWKSQNHHHYLQCNHRGCHPHFHHSWPWKAHFWHRIWVRETSRPQCSQSLEACSCKRSDAATCCFRLKTWDTMQNKVCWFQQHGWRISELPWVALTMLSPVRATVVWAEWKSQKWLVAIIT